MLVAIIESVFQSGAAIAYKTAYKDGVINMSFVCRYLSGTFVAALWPIR